jgi:prepilin-type N-terminal cleavage/methylation domain-containing protein
MKYQKGFTLIELLIVIAIIGILAGVSIPAYLGQQKRAAQTEAFKNLEALRLLEEQFFSERSCYSDVDPCAAETITGTANIQAILPAFQPGPNAKFAYEIRTEVELTEPVALPYVAGSGIATEDNCFVASAIGIAGTRVADDGWAIDCNNIKNY